MKATGIVAEYNPFHNGHALHVNKTKNELKEPIIAVISGSFVQRGEPAFCDKWTRARFAVEGGVNLVLELPTAFSLRSAEFFARGSVELLAATGVVDCISCGAEHPELDFIGLAKKYFQEDVQAQIKAYLKLGYSYAAACEKAMGDGLSSPNDILAFEYAKACLQRGIKLHTIKREGRGYNDKELGGLASASAIREAFLEGLTPDLRASMPSFVWDTLAVNKAGYSREKLWELIRYNLALKTAEEIAATTECTEGLENLLKSTSACDNLEEALKLCTKKRYSTSRIRRLFTQLLFNKPVDLIRQKHPSYIRVLAFDDLGREILKEMKETASLPVINKLGQYPESGKSAEFAESISLDILACNLRELLGNGEGKLNKDFTLSPYYKR